MIVLTYGDKKFPEVNIRGGGKEGKYHGPDYVGTLHNLHVTVLYTKSLDDDKPWPKGDADSRDELFKPRQNLSVTVDGKDWINVTAPDMDWGPKVLYANIREVVGPKSAWVDVGFAFILNQLDPVTRGLVVSNKWAMSGITDNRYWKKIICRGEAVLRSDVLKAGQTRITDLQAAFLMPVQAAGYKRDLVQVEASDDGLICRYSFVDSQVPYVLLPALISDASVTVTTATNISTDDDLIMGGISAGADAINRGVEVGAWSMGGDVSRAVTGGLTGLTTFAQKSIALAIAAVPSLTLQVSATVFGLPESQCDGLLQAAEFLALARIRSLPGFKTDASLALRSAQANIDSRQRIATYTVLIQKQAVATISRNVLKTFIENGAVGGGFEVAKNIITARENVAQSLESYTKAMVNQAAEESRDGVSQKLKKPNTGFTGSSEPSKLVTAAITEGEGKELDLPMDAQGRKVLFL